MRAVTFFCLFFFFAAFTYAATTKPTPDQITNAEQIRAIGVSTGMDKKDPAEIIKAALAMNSGNMKQIISPEEEAALICVAKKMQDFQYTSPIVDYATFLIDETYASRIKKNMEIACGLDKFSAK